MAAAKLFLSIFAVIFVAELPDKTALASLVLATRHRALPVLVGAAAALAIQSLVAVIAGSLLSLLPPRAVHIGSGVLFLVSAIAMWRKKDEEADAGKDGGEVGFVKAFTLAFTVVFVAEWGDLTQIATAGFAARTKQPVLVFCAATAALWAVASVAVIAGNRAGHLLNPKVTQKIAAVLFALVGVALIAGIF
ncbi:MAG TPA: TMEM165/GDT1 family protein [Polyangia bacterium]|jgi:putative Ca2+/H+ antiporter (TMEM165/GDT1 family)|nr:TMEM165/GDT1 family protein [Polyangia bacterium]